MASAVLGRRAAWPGALVIRRRLVLAHFLHLPANGVWARAGTTQRTESHSRARACAELITIRAFAFATCGNRDGAPVGVCKGASISPTSRHLADLIASECTAATARFISGPRACRRPTAGSDVRLAPLFWPASIAGHASAAHARASMDVKVAATSPPPPRADHRLACRFKFSPCFEAAQLPLPLPVCAPSVPSFDHASGPIRAAVAAINCAIAAVGSTPFASGRGRAGLVSRTRMPAAHGADPGAPVRHGSATNARACDGGAGLTLAGSLRPRNVDTADSVVVWVTRRRSAAAPGRPREARASRSWVRCVCHWCP